MKRMRALLAVLIVSTPVWGVFPPPLKDEGKFFKPAMIEKANSKIREIYEKYKKDVVIETLASLTAEQIKEMDDDGKDRFFAKLALTRSKALGLNGVYILICKKPQRLQVHMDPGTQKSAFTATNRDELVNKFRGKFRDDDFDGGLHAAVEYVEATLKKSIK